MKPTCLMTNCDRSRNERFAICNSCWTMLPTNLRFGITRAYSPEIDPDHLTVGLRRALTAAYTWVLTTFGTDDGPTRPGYTPEKWERLKETVRARDAARAERKAELAANPPKKPRPPYLKLVP